DDVFIFASLSRAPTTPRYCDRQSYLHPPCQNSRHRQSRIANQHRTRTQKRKKKEDMHARKQSNNRLNVPRQKPVNSVSRPTLPTSPQPA
ncbi:unnamed protein product, partial [Ectocarpus sp. 8 AP-2014]